MSQPLRRKPLPNLSPESRRDWLLLTSLSTSTRCTFHSICLRFLEENREFTRLKRNFTLLDQFDQQYFIYQRLSEYQEIEGSEYIFGKLSAFSWRGAESLMKWVNKVSEEALDPEDLLNATEPEAQALGRCYQQYQEHLEAENCLDFSTIQVEALRLFDERPEVLDEIRSKIQYLMVDEYQDTNTIQETHPIQTRGTGL